MFFDKFESPCDLLGSIEKQINFILSSFWDYEQQLPCFFGLNRWQHTRQKLAGEIRQIIEQEEPRILLQDVRINSENILIIFQVKEEEKRYEYIHQRNI